MGGIAGIGRSLKRAWGSETNPLTQKQKAETYDPNQANFQLGSDANATAEQQRAQQLAANAAARRRHQRQNGTP